MLPESRNDHGADSCLAVLLDGQQEATSHPLSSQVESVDRKGRQDLTDVLPRRTSIKPSNPCTFRFKYREFSVVMGPHIRTRYQGTTIIGRMSLSFDKPDFERCLL